MPILAVIELIIQIYFAVHAIRNERNFYWVYIIIFLPGIGSLIYFFAEFLPSLQGNYRVKKLKTDIGHAVNPGKQLRRLQDQVEIVPSVTNKKALAEAYINRGWFDNAISIYESCQSGIHENDLSLLEGLSCAYFFKGDYPAATVYLEKVLGHNEAVSTNQFRLLLARSWEELGKNELADTAYREVLKSFSGEEARCRYALFLKKTGRNGEADRLFNETLKNARLSPRYYRKAQRKWIGIAKNEKSQ